LKAERAYRNALALYEPLVAEFPRVSEYRQKRARCRCALGEFLGFDSKRTGEAEDLFRQAVTDQQRLAADFPQVPVYRAELADSYVLQGDLLEKRMRRPGEADKSYREARTLYHKLVVDFAAESYLSSLADVLNRLARLRRSNLLQCWVAGLNQSPLQSLAPLLLGRDNLADAYCLLDEAIRYQQQARELGNDHPKYRWALLRHYRELAEVLVLMRDHAKAAEAAEQLHQLIPGDYEIYFITAQFLARCVPLAKTDGRLSQRQQDKLSDSYGRDAVQMLEKAVAGGYRNIQQLEIEPNLHSLRSRPDFNNVLNQLAAKK
jgi:tetratricopeptide (TPR) repeat protein